MDVNAKVLEVLKAEGQPLKSAEIAERAGADKKDVDKAIKALKAAGKVTSPKNCYYAAAD
jgi:DNA-binding IclR family transcriptional regulator